MSESERSDLFEDGRAMKQASAAGAPWIMPVNSGI